MRYTVNASNTSVLVEGLPTSSGLKAEAFRDPLWNRIENFELDMPGCGLTFSERAAKENAWTLGYTRRVIAEYRRFIFLAMRAAHVVCPSEDVDQIWHMHLTYTRSYWDELCKEVLQSPLHHGPTKGGTQEREKYYHLYEKTKSSYEQWFGDAPPPDIWPAADIRFGEDLQHVRVNTQHNWIIPKLGWRKVALGTSAAGLLIPVAQVAINPLDWTGPNFLVLYFGLLFITILVSCLARIWLLNSAEPDSFLRPGDPNAIGPLEAAWMQGGNQRAITCALVELAQADAIELHGSNVKAGPAVASAQPEHRITQLILQSVAETPAGSSWRSLCRDANVGLVAMRQSLEEKGLVTSFTQRANAIAMVLATVGGVAILGAAKLWVGFSRGRPIGILIFGEIVTIAAVVVLILSLPRMTQAGKRLIKQLRKEARQTPERLFVTPGNEGEEVRQGDQGLLWGAALLGTSILASTPYAEIDAYTRRQIAAGGGYTGGCGGTGCGGGGGGGGCGGGCGGCGG